MESKNTATGEQQSLQLLHTIDSSQTLTADNISGRPFHLEKRFQQKLSLSESGNNKATSLKRVQAAEQKRNALLEERKGKLSKNYIVKVKKIAKEAKANREHKIHLLSKSMESAEFNRNQYIEQKRAKSKKIVERAKHVALENQRRTEQEQERRKAELERRLKNTEERRLAHLGNRYKKKQPSQKSKRRTSSSSSSTAFSTRSSKTAATATTTTTEVSPQLLAESMKVTNNTSTCSAMMMTAAKTKRSSITPPTTATAAAGAGTGVTSPKLLPATVSKKKPSSWSIILKAFRDLDLPSSSASPQTWPNFDDLGKLLQQPKVIVITTKVLNTALKITDDNSRFRARRLLTSYMMLMCPEGILGDINRPDEKRVYESAKEMLRLFEIWLKAHGHPGATAARLAFVDAYNGYCSVFEAWKSKDYTEFVQFMIKDYVQQSTLRQTMLASEDQLSSIETLDVNLEKRKKQIEQFAGKEGLEQLQRALEAALGSTSTGRKKQQELRTPRTPDLEGDYFSSQQQKQNDSDHTAEREHMSQLLNQYVSPTDNDNADGLSNAQLAHELIMDPDFKLQNLSSNTADGLEKRVRDIAQKAFLNKIAEEIENDQAHVVIPPLISDIKNRLMALSIPGAPIYNNIQETIDIALIEQQLKQHPQQFDIQKVIDHILDLMTWMCAPIRDEEIRNVRNLRSTTADIDRKGSISILLNQIGSIFSILESMTLDHANYKLQLLRPHLMPIAVDYERARFEAWLSQEQQRFSAASPSLLAKTQTWLTRSADKLCQEAAQRNPENIQPQKNNKPSHDAILEEAFLSLLCQPALISRDNVSETLLLDVTRLIQFQNEIQAITIVGALVMIAKTFGSNVNENSMLELVSRLFTMLEDNSTIDHLSAEITRVVLVRPEQHAMLKNIVDKTLNQKDTIFNLILNRVAKVIKSTIHDRKFVSSAVLESNGLQYVQSQLQATALKIQRLVNHNRKVYATWYDEIITKAVNDNLALGEQQQQ